jgi:uncharacterized protein (TIGR02246 family)
VRNERSPIVVGAVRSRIEETNLQFTEALNRGDISSVVALYTDNAVILPPNSEPVRGREGARALFEGMVQAMGLPTLRLSTVEVTEVGDTAYEVGDYTMTMKPPTGEAINDHGKYVVVWKRQGDAAWKLAVDMWSTNLPLPNP